MISFQVLMMSLAAAEADIKVNYTRTWTNCSKAELAKDFDQWMPLYSKSGLPSLICTIIS